MTVYVVVCDCRADDPLQVGVVHDVRGEGRGVRIESVPGRDRAVLGHKSKAGNRRSIEPMSCVRCGCEVQLRGATMGEVLDLITAEMPGGSLQELWGRVATVDEVLAEVDHSVWPPTVVRWAAVKGEAQKIPLAALCRLVSQRHKRRDTR